MLVFSVAFSVDIRDCLAVGARVDDHPRLARRRLRASTRIGTDRPKHTPKHRGNINLFFALASALGITLALPRHWLIRATLVSRQISDKKAAALPLKMA